MNQSQLNAQSVLDQAATLQQPYTADVCVARFQVADKLNRYQELSSRLGAMYTAAQLRTATRSLLNALEVAR
jgi:hypothetical protein